MGGRRHWDVRMRRAKAQAARACLYADNRSPRTADQTRDMTFQAVAQGDVTGLQARSEAKKAHGWLRSLEASRSVGLCSASRRPDVGPDGVAKGEAFFLAHEATTIASEATCSCLVSA